jgi:hypothetical protein
MEACSSETSVDFQRITRRYIPEQVSPPSSGSNNPSKVRWYLAQFFFDPEEGGDMFLRNVG